MFVRGLVRYSDMSIATVCIVDREPSVRASLEEILTAAGYRTEQFASPDGLLSAAIVPENSCAIVEIDPPDLDGMEFLRQVENRNLDLPIVLTSDRPDVRTAVEALRAGAQEFLQKPIHGYTLLTTVRSVFEKASRQRKLRALRQTLQVRFEALSPREREVMQLAVRGLSNPEISKRIKIGQRTVESYRLSMMGKMQAASIVELVLQAHALGEVPDWTARE